MSKAPASTLSYARSIANRIPKTELDWHTQRVRVGLDTEEGILSTARSLWSWCPGKPTDGLKGWERAILRWYLISLCIVDMKGGRDKDAARNDMITWLGQISSSHPTTQKQAQALISATLSLFKHFDLISGHRPWECLLADIPLTSVRSAASRLNLQPFFPPQKKREIQEFMPLCPVFFVKNWRPSASCTDICDALGLSLRSENDFIEFENRVLKSALPAVISSEPEAVASISDDLPSENDSELDIDETNRDLNSFREYFHVEHMFSITLSASLRAYTTFPLTDTVKRKAFRAGSIPQQDIEFRKPNVHLYRWIGAYESIVEDVVACLADAKIISGESALIQKGAFHHMHGYLTMNQGYLSILIPTTNTACVIAIKDETGEVEWVGWTVQSGLALRGGVSLWTETQIDYICISFLLSQPS